MQGAVWQPAFIPAAAAFPGRPLICLVLVTGSLELSSLSCTAFLRQAGEEGRKGKAGLERQNQGQKLQVPAGEAFGVVPDVLH